MKVKFRESDTPHHLIRRPDHRQLYATVALIAAVVAVVVVAVTTMSPSHPHASTRSTLPTPSSKPRPTTTTPLDGQITSAIDRQIGLWLTVAWCQPIKDGNFADAAMWAKNPPPGVNPSGFPQPQPGTAAAAWRSPSHPSDLSSAQALAPPQGPYKLSEVFCDTAIAAPVWHVSASGDGSVEVPVEVEASYKLTVGRTSSNVHVLFASTVPIIHSGHTYNMASCCVLKAGPDQRVRVPSG